jgi:hypothetical protein
MILLSLVPCAIADFRHEIHQAIITDSTFAHLTNSSVLIQGDHLNYKEISDQTHMTSSNISVAFCRFLGCRRPGDGGGALRLFSCHLTINDSYFIACEAHCGGSIFAISTIITIRRSAFHRCHAATSGGVMLSFSAPLILLTSTNSSVATSGDESAAIACSTSGALHGAHVVFAVTRSPSTGLVTADDTGISFTFGVIFSHEGECALCAIGTQSVMVNNIIFLNLTVRLVLFSDGRSSVKIQGCSFDTDKKDLKIAGRNVSWHNNQYNMRSMPPQLNYRDLNHLIDEDEILRTSAIPEIPGHRLFGGIAAVEGIVVITLIVSVLAYGARGRSPERIPLAIEQGTRATRDEVNRRLADLDDPLFEF